jgi:hypothetical protein
MNANMKRREFITLLGGAAVAWSLAARAQQSAMPVIGFLSSGQPQVFAHMIDAFRHGLNETGYVVGQNVAFEHRAAGSEYDRPISSHGRRSGSPPGRGDLCDGRHCRGAGGQNGDFHHSNRFLHGW